MPIYAGFPALQMGWGTVKIKDGKKFSSAILQETKTRILYPDKCIKCTPRQIGAMNKHSSACTGDSGGPLVVQRDAGEAYTIVGIFSAVAKNCILNNNLSNIYFKTYILTYSFYYHAKV